VLLRLVEPFGSATLRILLRCGLPVLPCTGVRRMRLTLPSLDNGGTDARSRGATPVRCAPASCLAAASLHIHVQSFDRFDEILYLVEKSSDLTLPALGRGRPTGLPHRSVATSLSQLRLDSRSASTNSFPGDLLFWRAMPPSKRPANRLPASLFSVSNKS